jgi:fucose permease
VSRQLDFPEIPIVHSAREQISVRLPAIFWAYWTLIVLAVAVEFCIIFWSATFLEVERQLPKANAALVMSVFLGAMVAGRFLGSRISQYFRSEQIVLGSVGMGLIGFLLHWGAAPLALTMAGLFLAGIGVSNLYPQLLALAVGTAPQQTDTASARASLASGIAILCLPLLLGGLADAVGIGRAYGMVIVLLAFVAIGMLIVRNLPQQGPQHRHLKSGEFGA